MDFKIFFYIFSGPLYSQLFPHRPFLISYHRDCLCSFSALGATEWGTISRRQIANSLVQATCFSLRQGIAWTLNAYQRHKGTGTWSRTLGCPEGSAPSSQTQSWNTNLRAIVSLFCCCFILINDVGKDWDCKSVPGELNFIWWVLNKIMGVKMY